MIADEVMTGFGRTGKWFAMDHRDVVPDMMTLAPPLIVFKDEINEGLTIMDKALEAVDAYTA